MIDAPDDAAFDDLLRSAMHARPESPRIPDLAGRAIARATLPQGVRPLSRTEKVRLRQHRTLNRVASLVALLLISLILISGYLVVPSGWLNPVANNSAGIYGSPNGIAYQGSSEFDLLLLGGICLLTALLGLSVGRFFITGSDELEPADLLRLT